jgi:hypothetical protein
MDQTEFASHVLERFCMKDSKQISKRIVARSSSNNTGEILQATDHEFCGKFALLGLLVKTRYCSLCIQTVKVFFISLPCTFGGSQVFIEVLEWDQRIGYGVFEAGQLWTHAFSQSLVGLC